MELFLPEWAISELPWEIYTQSDFGVDFLRFWIPIDWSLALISANVSVPNIPAEVSSA